jgi:hypothetical protein
VALAPAWSGKEGHPHPPNEFLTVAEGRRDPQAEQQTVRNWLFSTAFAFVLQPPRLKGGAPTDRHDRRRHARTTYEKDERTAAAGR